MQRRRGCIQSTNGTVSAFESWAVNGIDFISFDPESQRWTSQSPSAETVEHLWNSNKARNSVFRGFIRYQCPQMIQMIKLRPIKQDTGESWSSLDKYTYVHNVYICIYVYKYMYIFFVRNAASQVMLH